MRKLTLFFTTLFLSVGMAWAQTNANALVTFTNVQADGTEYVLYINNDGVLDFSTESAAALGEAAQFRATKQSNGKWTFYNESKEYYMIWRGNTSGGYNSNAGTLGEYNATYCDWDVKTGSVDGLFRIVSKRSNGSDGSIVIMRSGRFDAYGDSNGFVGTGNAHSNQFRIDVVNHFGFEAAKDYASINKWYYLTFRPDWGRKLYYDGTSNVLDATKTTIDAKDKDAYSWAFIGNPFVGYKVVNKKAGKDKYLNAADGGAIVGTAEHIFTLTESSYATNGFFMAGNGKDRFNLQGGQVKYWGGADVGSTFVVTLRDDAADLQASINNATALLDNLGNGTTVGYVTADSRNAIESAISQAEDAISNNSGYDAAEADLQAAVNGVKTIQPEAGKYYTINSEYYKNDGTGEPIGLDVNANKLIFNRDLNVSKWFQFVDAGNGEFYLYNVKSGLYLNSNGGHNSGQVSAGATTTSDAKAVTISNMGKGNIVKIVPVGGAMIHAQAGGNVVAWNNDAYTSASAWTIVEVENPGVAYIDNTNYATLAEAVAAWQEGQTINLLANTDETVVLPKGMKLDVINLNGFTAPNVSEFVPVAKIGEAEYASLAAAIKAASAGATITFVDNVTENVTLSKNVTIDGANFKYTGTMTVNKGLTVTVENVNFVNGGIDKPKAQKSDTGTYTIKNCTFVDEGKYPYSLRFYGAKTLNVENCTVKNYLYSFLYINGSTQNLNINNVTVEDCPNYAVYFATGVNNATIEGLTVKNSNNGILVNNAAARTLTIKDCKMENVTTAINHANGTSAITANVQGQNNFGTAVLSQYAKCVLAEDATLAATTAGLNVTTNIEGKEVAYQGGKYSVVVKRAPAGQVAYRADVTDKTDREGIAILLKDPYAKNSLVVKVYNGETLMFTCTRLDIDDEGKVMFPVTANTTANIVLWGKPSGSWNNEIHVAPTELNVPNKVEVYADGVLTDSYTHETGTVLGTNLEKYLALDCVKKFAAKIGNVGYETLDAALAAAEADETVTLLRDVTASEIITINKAITLNGNDKTLTSTAGRAINIDTEGKVVIKDLTVNAGERAFNIINKPATVELNGVTAVANNNAVMIATSAGAANVTIDGCDFTGLAVVNVAGKKSNVAIKNSTITNVDNNPDENYGAITVWTSAEEAVVNVENTTITVADDSKEAYVFPANATVTGVNEVGRIIVTVGDAGFDTLAEAIDYANGETITFVMDAKGPGVVINKNAVIDFNGKTYTFTEGVGSTGTESNGFQILKGNTVTLKNGTLNVDADAADKFYILVQNYANLTVEGMTLDGTNLDKYSATDGDSYVLSNNSGTVNVIGSTIKANDEGSLAFAMDACDKTANGYELPVVTVNAESTIDGNVEVSATLNMNGTLNGTIIINAATGTVNGVEGLNVITNVADHKVVNNNGAYTVAAKNYVAQVGEAKYETFAAAVAAAPAGGTVTLVADAVEAKTVVLTKNLTIDGAGKTFTGAIEFKKSNGTFTVKNVNFNGAGNRVYALKSQTSTTNLTVEGCTATGYTYGFLYANKAIANVTVTDVTVKDVTYGVHSAYGTNVTLNNFVAENVEYGVMVQNYGTRKVVLNNCTFTGSANPLYIWERNQTNKITFNFKGANEMGKADYCTSAMAVVNAEAVAGTKVCGTLAEAVVAAEAGETVTLLRNVQLDALLTIDKSITLDLGEYNITRDARTALYVEGDDVEVTINGEGTVSGKQALYVGGGLVKVYGGNFHGLTEAVYVQNSGKAEIYGGKFSSDNVTYVLNEYDKTRETSDITVYGGTFVGFNPADNAAEGAGTNFVATGYVIQENADGTYSVVFDPTHGKVAKVGEEYYATLTEALAAAAAGTTVELIADVNEDVTLTKNVTINGANFKYTGTMSANANITVNVLDLNFVNAGFSKGTKSTNGNYTFKGCTFDGQGTYSRAIYVRGANKVVLENCTATGYDYFMYVPNALNNSVTVKNVTIENCSGYAVMFNSGAGKATFENFTVKNTPTAIIYNNSANRALTLNNCTMENVDTAIKHTGNGDKNITCTFVGKNNLGGAFSEYVVLQNAALAGTTIYASLAEAVAADGNEVKLLGNSTGAGVVIDKDLTIDFNGNTYTFTEGVGSTGTESNGFQILKDNDVVLKNGTLNVAAASASKFYTIIQNYATLTVEDMNLDGTNLDKWSTTDGDSYVFSNNNANVVIKGNTNITANNDGDKAFAFDSDKAANVTVETTGTIAGKIEKAADATITIYSGTYTMDVNEWCAEGYAATKNADNMWTVGKAIAQVGEVKYASIQAAIDAAPDGETVKMLDNVTLDTKTLATQNDGYAVLVNVNGKKVTIDLNGKTITVNAAAADLAAAKGKMLLTVFHADTNGELTLTDNTADKAGAVVVNVNDATVYSVFASESQYSDKSESGKLTVNAGNYKTVGKIANAMFFTDANEVITVNGGNFHCDGATTNAPYPWMFNTYLNNVIHVTVNGGTFNVDVNHQHRPFEVYVPETFAVNANGDGTWTVVPAVAYITEKLGDTVHESGDLEHKVGYTTLAAAVEAAVEGDYVTLLKSVTGAGLVINKGLTIDFGGNTYSFNEGVGSTGTASNGFQILKGNEVTLKNGTLNVAEAAKGEFYILVQNYANLTVADMNLDGTNLDKYSATDGDSYVLSNNSGDVVITGETNITANDEGDKAFAFDACDKTAWGYTLPVVNVETTGKIAGLIESTATIAISGGTFTTPIADEWCAEYYVPVQNADGTYGVEKRYIETLEIDDDKYFAGDMPAEGFVNKNEQTVGTLTYKRTFKKANLWQALYVPFEIPVASLNDLGYEVAYLYDVHNKVVDGEVIDPADIESVHFVKIKKGTLKASYPYIIRPTSEADLNLSLTLYDAKLYSTDKKNDVESSTTTTRYIFTGTYADAYSTDITGDANIPCARINANGNWQKMTTTAILVPFRICMYIVNKDGSPVIMSDEAAKSIKIRIVGEENEDETTGIKFYEFDTEQASDYIYDLHGRRVLEPQKGSIYIVNGKKVIF